MRRRTCIRALLRRGSGGAAPEENEANYEGSRAGKVHRLDHLSLTARAQLSVHSSVPGLAERFGNKEEI
jgi:hypothetical protein